MAETNPWRPIATAPSGVGNQIRPSEVLQPTYSTSAVSIVFTALIPS